MTTFSRWHIATLLLTLPLTAAAQSTLIIRADAACALTVNGVAQGQLAADTAKPIKVGAGEQLIECKTAKGKVDQKLSIESGSQKVIELKPSLFTRYSAPGDGTVVDSTTGLQWAQRDNGQDINWNSARSYCSNLGTAGGGWRLPSMNELQGIYDDSVTLTTACGQSTCRVSPIFSLSGFVAWSNESSGSSVAWGFYLDYGTRLSAAVSGAGGIRALCVRQRS